jgi:hypothetical protein
VAWRTSIGICGCFFFRLPQFFPSITVGIFRFPIFLFSSLSSWGGYRQVGWLMIIWKTTTTEKPLEEDRFFGVQDDSSVLVVELEVMVNQ